MSTLIAIVIILFCIPAIILGWAKQKEKWEMRKHYEKLMRFEHKINRSEDIC